MINTVIREVSLYRRGFTVTSEGVMHLEKGTNSVRIAGLLNGTNEDTVKLFVTGKLSVRYQGGETRIITERKTFLYS